MGMGRGWGEEEMGQGRDGGAEGGGWEVRRRQGRGRGEGKRIGTWGDGMRADEGISGWNRG